ncbi:hypothetical protein DSECCO2_413560 [anaerobic digester metagenome]
MHGRDSGRLPIAHGPVVSITDCGWEVGFGDRCEAEYGIERLESRYRVHEEVLALAGIHESCHDAAGVTASAKRGGSEDCVDLTTVRVPSTHGKGADGPVREEGEDPVGYRVTPGPVVIAPDRCGEGELYGIQLANREPGFVGDQSLVRS